MKRKFDSGHSVRGLAVGILTRVQQENAYSNLLLNQVLQTEHLTARDQALLTQIVYGSLQHRLTLEYWLTPFIKNKKVLPWVYELLLAALFQLQYLDRVPARAILDESIKVAKINGHDGIRKFVTGVLHAILRQKLPNPQEIKDPLQKMSICYSLPIWLLKQLVKENGKAKTATILKTINQPPHQVVRINQSYLSTAAAKQQLEAAGFMCEFSRLSPTSLIIKHGVASQSKLFSAGKLVFQDESAAQVVAGMQIQPADQVLDACAAPGGKTLQIADALTSGSVTALDIHPHKIKLIEKNAQRCGFSPQVKAKCLDARQAIMEFKPATFDKILVDAPCSGIGLLRRKPEIRYRKTAAGVARLQQLQLELLASLTGLVKNNGILTYSTCTILKSENDQVITKFLNQHPDFKLLRKRTILPDEFDSDGFFMAFLEKTQD